MCTLWIRGTYRKRESGMYSKLGRYCYRRYLGSVDLIDPETQKKETNMHVCFERDLDKDTRKIVIYRGKNAHMYFDYACGCAATTRTIDAMIDAIRLDVFRWEDRLETDDFLSLGAYANIEFIVYMNIMFLCSHVDGKIYVHALGLIH